jgi:hypothetical protein
VTTQEAWDTVGYIEAADEPIDVVDVRKVKDRGSMCVELVGRDHDRGAVVAFVLSGRDAEAALACDAWFRLAPSAVIAMGAPEPAMAMRSR